MKEKFSKHPLIPRVLLLGAGQVGKSSLCAQFMSSDHVNTYLKVGKLHLHYQKEVSIFFVHIFTNFVFSAF